MTTPTTADVGAVGSAGFAGATWLAPLSEFLQIGATAVAIVAGCYAIAWHRARLKNLRSKQNDKSNRRAS